jgi:hypothetical protein
VVNVVQRCQLSVAVRARHHIKEPALLEFVAVVYQAIKILDNTFTSKVHSPRLALP